jgi:hypothetical protein
VICRSLTVVCLSLLLSPGTPASAAPAGSDQEGAYRVLEPKTSEHLHESAHFVARWNNDHGVKLSAEEIRTGLDTLEKIRSFYLDTVGFVAPYAGESVRYKININVSDKGWASGSGTGKNHPAMWLHFNAFKDQHALAHEFAHGLQFGSMGLRDSPYVGWSWESHAEWMTHQMYPTQTGCSDQLVNAPHLYYGSTRDRYGNWQFWEYLKDTFGYGAVNDIWSKAKRQGDKDAGIEDPLVVLARNRGWKTSDLNDQFGHWAMRNVTWDYTNGPVFRNSYGSYDDRSGPRRNRVSVLDVVDAKQRRYAIPDYRAPQRYGYNLVRIDPEPGPLSGSITVQFHGLVQEQAGVKRFKQQFENEPASVPAPASDWRWGLVAVDGKGAPRYSALQRGAAARLTFPLKSGEDQVWLVVVATPTEYHRIQWDQMYYTIYRYPWTAEILGGTPRGSAPGPLEKTAGRQGGPHRNGGGWVDATAKVAPTAFVGPAAMVLDQAQVSGAARVEDQAIISGTAQVRDNAVVRGRALVTGQAVVSGRARVEQDATVRGGRVEDEATVRALTLMEHPDTRVGGQAEIAAVMNTLPGHAFGGTARLLGDLEVHVPVTQGVFYGMVAPEMVKDVRWGAGRKEPEREVTATKR